MTKTDDPVKELTQVAQSLAGLVSNRAELDQSYNRLTEMVQDLASKKLTEKIPADDNSNLVGMPHMETRKRAPRFRPKGELARESAKKKARAVKKLSFDIRTYLNHACSHIIVYY